MAIFRSLFTVPLVALLAACGSDSSSSGGGGGNPNPEPDRQVSGVLISPESNSQTTLRFSSDASPVMSMAATMAVECPGDIPAGYVRLADVTVTLLDVDGNALAETLTTDECGIFDGTVPEQAMSIRAEPGNGLRPMEADIAVFVVDDDDAEPTVVSTISDSAEYEIRSLLRQSDGRFAFTVADSESGRPVIGIPEGRFSLDIAGTDVPLDSVTVAAQAQEQAAISLVLDASDSMRTEVYQDGDGNSIKRWHVAREATHLFLNEKGANDLTGIVIFSAIDEVNLINDAFLDQAFDFIDGEGNSTSFAFSVSGFTTEVVGLRTVADLYSPYSKLYQFPSSGLQTEPHPDSAAIQASYYPWASSTALYHAVALGLDEVAMQSPTRKAVVTMGDGEDNSYGISLQEVIDHANNLAIPVFSIALGVDESSTGGQALRQLGEETGGDFVSVSDDGAETELLRVFESIQIGIVFQYLATLADADQVQPGDTVTLRLEYNGLETERQFTVPTP
ncbi:von Willebrand factor, type A [Alcanivorax balearicus MACL04]|uniref:von Willebrand factor, type A n=1 Tax=Alloalcanivorax balearicus MACL04 TaxID=1177182 RepID=A0ABT2QWR8_9GAMM|nr:hypothetical protein [Alloalcanivorax balearicus]MCU5781976.1 von Willebrand factor, type A [Alloalcanivorax balearicus MACL04]